jgi:hypothetical protein
MSHPEITNRTPFAFQALYLVDEEWRPLVVPVVKATLSLAPEGCVIAEEQLPLSTSGEYWGKNPDTSSYRYEPEVAFFKPATDVVLNGHAYAARGTTRQMLVSLQVGPLSKQLLVCGDRVWFRSLGSLAASHPTPFEKMPLVYERAFGGWDRGHPDPARHHCEPRNPSGTGFRGTSGFQDGVPLPNIEDPQAPLRSFGDRPAPAGFGFLSPHWQPRAALAGTYDADWQRQRAPLLPKDFDRRHLNAASSGLISRGYLRGDEPVRALGVTPNGTLSFTLPALGPPRARIELATGVTSELALALDTVIIEPDEQRVQLFWRGHLVLRKGPLDVRAIEIEPSAALC